MLKVQTGRGPVGATVLCTVVSKRHVPPINARTSTSRYPQKTEKRRVATGGVSRSWERKFGHGPTTSFSTSTVTSIPICRWIWRSCDLVKERDENRQLSCWSIPDIKSFRIWSEDVSGKELKLTCMPLATWKLPANFGESLKIHVYQGMDDSNDEFIRRVCVDCSVVVDTRQSFWNVRFMAGMTIICFTHLFPITSNRRKLELEYNTTDLWCSTHHSTWYISHSHVPNSENSCLR